MKRNGTAVAEPAKEQMKTGWRMVRFDEIADNITDRVDDPSQAGVDRYVGLEHLDPESLKIRRWGVPTDVEATKLRFQPGDVIFGKRRAYQRKLAVADFEGICSAHAMVLRAKPDGIVPEFLPFFMQSDVFFERALAISVGSLSPTINWTALAGQTFALPSEPVQKKLAVILWAIENAADSIRLLVESQQELASALLNDFLLKYSGAQRTCGELLVDGPRNGISPPSNVEGRGYPTLSIGAVRNGRVAPEGNLKYAELDRAQLEMFRLKHDDIQGTAIAT